MLPYNKAVLLAGGHGTRLQPLTYYCNKHLLPLYRKNQQAVPIIESAVSQLYWSGFWDVAVILGDFRAEDIISFFHKYIKPKYKTMNFTYYYQGEPLGIAHAVSLAKDFVKDRQYFLVYLGDNYFSEILYPDYISGLYPVTPDWSCSCSLLFAEVKDPTRFGSPVFDKNKNLVKIVEKPKKPQTNLALTGCYLFNTTFYFDAYKYLKPSKRGEYELTDIINEALKFDPNLVHWKVFDGFWSDAGTFQSIYNIQKYINRQEETNHSKN